MSQEDSTAPDVDFAVKVLQEHERKLFDAFRATLQSPIQAYTDHNGHLDRELVSQQLGIRSMLLTGLIGHMGRLEVALFALSLRGMGVDYGELMEDFGQTVADHDEALTAMQASLVAVADPSEGRETTP